MWRAFRRSGKPCATAPVGLSCLRVQCSDAMFAPVVNRFDVYDLDVDDEVRDYMAVMKAPPAWIDWQEAALAESWIVPADEA